MVRDLLRDRDTNASDTVRLAEGVGGGRAGRVGVLDLDLEDGLPRDCDREALCDGSKALREGVRDAVRDRLGVTPVAAVATQR